MGSILAESSHLDRIEKLLSPVRDIFAAVFFVSIGMLINPLDIQKYWLIILIASLITIFGKIISIFLGAKLSGESNHTSFEIGSSMAQTGEFSYIIAGLGLTLGMSSFLYPVAVTVSVITTFTTPYLIKLSQRILKN